MKLRAPRRLAALLVGAVFAASLTACGSDSSDETADAGSSDGGYYPHTMTTPHGDVTIQKKPTRIVTLGATNADELLALGEMPFKVAVDSTDLRNNYPWLAEDLADVAASDLLVSREPQAEAIAALEPDLIIAPTWTIKDKEVFDRLNEIAPTITANSTAANVDWDERLLTTAEAVNATDDAERLIADIKSDYAAVGDTVPGIDARTYNFAGFDGDQYFFGNGSLFELFGIAPAKNQENTQNDPYLSVERTNELAADLIAVWPTTDAARAQLDENALFQDLPAVKNGTVFYASQAAANALNDSGPLSLAWLLDEVTPTIKALG